MSTEPAVCDYTDTDYKKDFWIDSDRSYEDSVERIAVKRLFPKMTGSFLEIGAGFGRLVDVYADRCSKVTLMDYAFNLVEQAGSRVKALGLNNVEVTTGNVYDLSAFSGRFDGTMMIRVMHHIEDVDKAFKEINKKLNEESFFILEYANKRNLLEIIRWFFRRPNIKPFSLDPGKRGEGLFYNFHPKYIEQKLTDNGFAIEKQLVVSIFRNKLLKKIFGAKLLCTIENLLQYPMGFAKLSPSIFIKARKIKEV